MTSKIIQIIPADGWYIKWHDVDKKQFRYIKASCWALDEYGNIELLCPDGLPPGPSETAVFSLNLDMTHFSEDIPDEK